MKTSITLKFILLFSSYVYAGVFILIIISGCGFPLPEELTLLTAGFLVVFNVYRKGRVLSRNITMFF